MKRLRNSNFLQKSGKLAGLKMGRLVGFCLKLLDILTTLQENPDAFSRVANRRDYGLRDTSNTEKKGHHTKNLGLHKKHIWKVGFSVAHSPLIPELTQLALYSHLSQQAGVGESSLWTNSPAPERRVSDTNWGPQREAQTMKCPSPAILHTSFSVDKSNTEPPIRILVPHLKYENRKKKKTSLHL